MLQQILGGPRENGALSRLCRVDCGCTDVALEHFIAHTSGAYTRVNSFTIDSQPYYVVTGGLTERSC